MLRGAGGLKCGTFRSLSFTGSAIIFVQEVPMPDSRIRVKKLDDVTQVEFLDRNILDEANIQIIGDEIAALVDSAASPKLVISFANVEHLSSAALGTLITINNRVRSRSGQLRLCNINPQIYEVFAITRLNKLFQIHQTTDEALKSFS
jgi:anti-sigma B factor antagonist